MEPYAASAYRPRPPPVAVAPPPLASYGIVAKAAAAPREYVLDPIPLQPRPQPAVVPVRRGRQMRVFSGPEPAFAPAVLAGDPEPQPVAVTAPDPEPEAELVKVVRFGRARPRSRSRGAESAPAAAAIKPAAVVKPAAPAPKPAGILKGGKRSTSRSRKKQ